ncbi:MAG: type II secretion system protein [Gammaproteobacteria bacterium]
MRNRQSGFTIIELVMVIVILGILAAFALPRFADLGGSAKKAAVEGIAGSMRSAAGLAHSMQLATGTAVNGTVSMEGQTITLANGYPNVATIDEAAGWDLAGYTASGAASPVTWTRDDAATPANCKITYTEAPAGGAATVATVTTGC